MTALRRGLYRTCHGAFLAKNRAKPALRGILPRLRNLAGPSRRPHAHIPPPPEGAQPPAPEWGAMIATGRDNLVDQWWVATMPGIAIFIASLGFNLLGDGLRDVFDPKMR